MKHSSKGITALGALLFVLAFLLVLLGFDIGFIQYEMYCEDAPLTECFTKNNQPPEEKKPETKKPTIVIARGSFVFQKYNVIISMNIPLEGGAVSGEVTGTCNAKISGQYSGGDNGEISGKAFGSCTAVIPVPASGTFTGTVNQLTKKVPISGTGKALGISKDGSITLEY